MKYAFIFDFDGVLFNTMPAHFSAYQQALAEVNVPIDEQQFYSQAGMTGQDQLRYFAKKAGVVIDIQRVYERTREIQRTHPQPTESIACNLDLLKLLSSAGVPVAIATGSSRARVWPILQEHAVEVDAILTAEDARRGKPFPDLFLRAAQALGVAPANCIVIEDSDAGIQAAIAAGMKAYRFFGNSSGGQNVPFTKIPGNRLGS